MFCFVAPAEAAAEHERLLAIEESILQALEIPYRVVAIAVDELGASAAKKYDCEAWLPGQGRYRELTSCSNTTDYQARRLGIRFRPADGRPEHVNTLNGTAVAVGRTIIALLENGQQEDGSVRLPAPLVAAGAPEVLPPAGLDRLADDAERARLLVLEDHERRARGTAGRHSRPEPHAEGVPGPDERADAAHRRRRRPRPGRRRSAPAGRPRRRRGRAAG